ncbi:MAG: hypothetical protein ACRBG0_24015 [Lewinella sp.]|uniref:hypothetical protein n=1 Tax=Lewinella sp. TaxID=2004506 RepID=UPI003D6BDC5C
MKIEDKIEFKVENHKSRITFETTGGGSWKVWDRFISLDKEKMYHIGNVCGTCEFFFIKQSKSLEINFNEKHLIESLNDGNLELTKSTVSELSKIIPNGNYLVLNSRIKPEIVTSESDNNYFKKEQREAWRDDFDEESLKPEETEYNNYYREPLEDFGKMKYDHKEAFFNFFVPLYKTNELNESRVEFYKEKISKGEKPIVVSIGVLDVKTSEEYPLINGEEVNPDFGTHWCLANYVIDGHHKLKAASELNQEIGLITFVSRDESWKLIDDMVSKLTGQTKKKWQFWKN